MKKRAEVKPVTQQPPRDRVATLELLEGAAKPALDPRPKKTYPCRVCGSAGATEQSDLLCWICRRLKISAWREADQQPSLSE